MPPPSTRPPHLHAPFNATAQDICRKYNIPTAQYEKFTDPARAKAFIRELGAPIVVKVRPCSLCAKLRTAKTGRTVS